MTVTTSIDPARLLEEQLGQERTSRVEKVRRDLSQYADADQGVVVAIAARDGATGTAITNNVTLSMCRLASSPKPG